MGQRFVFDERLGISLPNLTLDWEDYSVSEREDIVTRWEIIRGAIPDRVFQFEREINKKQAELFEEDNFQLSCMLNSDIAELASRINDLHIWYRMNQEIETRRHS